MTARSFWPLSLVVVMSFHSITVESGPVPADGMDTEDPYFESISREPSELFSLGMRCGVFDVSDCLASTREYFDEEPIWVSAQPINRWFGYSTVLSSSILNPRYEIVWYGYDDYLAESLPRWQDIFDSQLRYRTDTVMRILKDPDCRSLASSEAVGIASELSDYCESAELFKYAALLDACLTSKARLREIIDSKLLPRTSNVYPRNKVEKLLRNTYLRENWIQQRCLESSIELVTGTTSLPLSLDQPIDDLVEVTQDIHDLVLEIAARSGNSWAIVSYLPDGGDVVYLEDLYSVNPLLTHRFLAAQRSTLSLEERSKHALEGYTLLDNPAVELQWYLMHLNGLMNYVAWDTTMITSGVDIPLTLLWQKPNEAATNR